jgi:D-glycero-alpha-D-manno-heptose-7-phosphate kinase
MQLVVTQTPLRISFLGGGTDYPEYFLKHQGVVLGTAIDKYAIISSSKFFSELFDYCIRIAYQKTECVSSINEIQHAPFRECLRWCNITSNIELHYSSNLPARTGLGSSSTFTVGLLNTLYSFQGRFVPPIELAYQAIEIERNVLKEYVGCQDQVFAAVGGFNLIEFRALDNIVVNRLPLSSQRLDELSAHLMIFFTGIKRRASDVAARQITVIDNNIDYLNDLKLLAEQGARVLINQGSLLPFGDLLHRAWLIKRKLDSGVSNPDIDLLYNLGMEAGALGGKLLGAGGGGFVLFFVPPERQNSVRKRLSNYVEIKIDINSNGTQVIHTIP